MLQLYFVAQRCPLSKEVFFLINNSTQYTCIDSTIVLILLFVQRFGRIILQPSSGMLVVALFILLVLISISPLLKFRTLIPFKLIYLGARGKATYGIRKTECLIIYPLVNTSFQLHFTIIIIIKAGLVIIWLIHFNKST